jgi:hypothetical protein
LQQTGEFLRHIFFCPLQNQILASLQVRLPGAKIRQDFFSFPQIHFRRMIHNAFFVSSAFVFHKFGENSSLRFGTRLALRYLRQQGRDFFFHFIPD